MKPQYFQSHKLSYAPQQALTNKLHSVEFKGTENSSSTTLMSVRGVSIRIPIGQTGH